MKAEAYFIAIPLWLILSYLQSGAIATFSSLLAVFVGVCGLIVQIRGTK